jgi:hypothetical protein
MYFCFIIFFFKKNMQESALQLMLHLILEIREELRRTKVTLNGEVRRKRV